MPSAFLLGFVLGVLFTFACAFVHLPFKIGIVVLPSSFPVGFVVFFVIGNVLMLDLVLLLPYIRSALGLLRKVKATVCMLFPGHSAAKPVLAARPEPNPALLFHDRPRHASSDSLFPVAVILVAMFHLHLVNKAASPTVLAVLALGEDREHAADDQLKVPGGYKGPVKLKELVLDIPALAICACVALSFIACDVLSGFSTLLGLVFAQARTIYCRGKCSTQELDDEEADTTLVDESDRESLIKTLNPSPAPFSPVLPSSNGLPLRASHSAPVLSDTVGERPRLRASTTSLQVGSDVEHTPAVAPSVSASSSLPRVSSIASPFNPMVPSFVPAAKLSSQDAPTAPVPANSKQEWVPSRQLSFAWARGGCATRITAPLISKGDLAPTPTVLKADAPAFVPKAPLAAPPSSPAPVANCLLAGRFRELRVIVSVSAGLLSSPVYVSILFTRVLDGLVITIWFRLISGLGPVYLYSLYFLLFTWISCIITNCQRALLSIFYSQSTLYLSTLSVFGLFYFFSILLIFFTTLNQEIRRSPGIALAFRGPVSQSKPSATSESVSLDAIMPLEWLYL
ncbi:hypothetical protein B0H11DRAFT_2185868 [Mycena galericulata]|nr:hypothetical protein B0H11DRAFT_2185868 [Mycena galericulata]